MNDPIYEAAPVRSLQTMLRTIAQTNPQQPSVVPDGIYSAQTVRAVESFQRRMGLAVTGRTDQQTWDRIVEVYDRARIEAEPAQPIEITLNAGQVLRKGEAHPLLYLVQTMLGILSMLAPEIPEPDYTGALDRQTQRSVLAFQMKSGLTPTAEVDKLTWKALALQFSHGCDEICRRTVK